MLILRNAVVTARAVGSSRTVFPKRLLLSGANEASSVLARYHHPQTNDAAPMRGKNDLLSVTTKSYFSSTPTVAQSLSDIDPTKLQIQLVDESKKKPKQPKETLKFGTITTDHILEINWNYKTGWEAPTIQPYGPFSIDPAAAVFHYGLECFEGMKAYKTCEHTDEIRLFRPELNMIRMNTSMKRLYLPTFDGDAFLECLKQLIKIDKDWIPTGDGYSLYIRPTGISTHPYIGVGASQTAKLYVILCPVGPYYPEGFNPVKLYADDKYVRAWPGGTGDTKIGGNYGPTIRPQMEAAAKGYSQILWLFGEEHYMTEVGTMNLFVYWINKETGRKELVTAPITRGDILPGVTRQSILELCREWKEFDVREETLTLPEVRTAIQENRLLEIFGSGTAAVISPVSTIYYQGEDLKIPLDGPDGKAGVLTQRLWKAITDIQYGRIPNHPWSVVI